MPSKMSDSDEVLISRQRHRSFRRHVSLAVGLAVNELAVNFASRRVYHGYLEVLIVAKAVVAEVLRKQPAVSDRFDVAVELDSDPVPHRNAVFHIEEECLHCHYLFYRSHASAASPRPEAAIGKGLPRLRALL